jgi:hypothetical protein
VLKPEPEPNAEAAPNADGLAVAPKAEVLFAAPNAEVVPAEDVLPNALVVAGVAPNALVVLGVVPKAELAPKADDPNAEVG